MACSSIARCAAAHACCRSAIARVRASESVARSERRAASSAVIFCAFDGWLTAASCCASTPLLSHPRAISGRYTKKQPLELERIGECGAARRVIEDAPPLTWTLTQLRGHARERIGRSEEHTSELQS